MTIEIGWKHGNKARWALGCDFDGNDIENEKTLSREDCENLCLSTRECTHFSWSKGVCYKKSGSVTVGNAHIKTHYVCGVIDQG